MDSIQKYNRSLLLMFAGLLFTCGAFGQGNYIRTRVPRTPIGTTTRLDQLTPTKDSVETTFNYFDGLGRPIQTVMQAASPNGKDIVQPVAYDAFGREVNKYLPYTMLSSSTGSYKDNALDPANGVFAYYAPAGSSGSQQGNGIPRTTRPYAQTVFEASPLNRVMEQGAPGFTWQPGNGHTMKMAYRTNGQTGFSRSLLTNNPGSNRVALYTATINANQSRTLARAGNTANYGSGVLYLTIMMDENRDSTSDGCLGTTEEYKDKQGRVIVKRTYNKYSAPGTSTILQQLSTYYVYDDLGNLSFVLPPGAKPDTTAAISQATLNALCYQYRYDERNRMTGKKLPGKAWEYMVYNKIDQVVATQDSSLRQNKQWQITKYDGLGRVIQTGIWQKTDPNFTAAVFRDSVYANDQWDIRNTLTTGSGYTITSYPTTLNTILSINYYDSYDNIPNFIATYDYPGASTMTKGLLTVSKTLILNTASTRLLQVHYYDDKGREIKTFTQHYLGGAQSNYSYDEVSSSYNFNDQPVATTRKHFIKNTNGTTPGTAAVLKLTATDSMTYDHKGRSRQHWNQLTGGSKTLLSQQEYNESGQLYRKKLHSTNSGATYFQTVIYNYNARGWLVKDSAQLFSQRLSYDDGAVPQYNGNISAQNWQTNGGTLTSTAYRYDKLNRLLSGNSSDGTSERGITYDLMGNIKTLSRYKTGTQIDSLIFNYPNGGLSNQADIITDLSGNNLGAPATAMNYTYTGDGQTKHDGRNNNNISYNILDLPQTITGTDNITYFYNAAGTKMAKVSVSGGVTTTTDYIGGIQYTTNGTGTPGIDFIQTSEARARYNGSNYIYEYDLTDHLGSPRLTFKGSGASPTVVQTTDYFPFGMEIGSFVNGVKNEYLYNKKELQEELGQYDYGARFYDPVIGKWTSIDPLAEVSRRWSPYNYGKNNPIIMVDPDGMLDLYFVDRTKDNSGTARTQNLINRGLGGNYASIDELGKLNLAVSAKQLEGFSTEQKNFYDVINGAANDTRGDVSIDVVAGSTESLIGNYFQKQIDIQDVEKFGSNREGSDEFSVFGHEIREQQENQLRTGKSLNSPLEDHKKGEEAEGKIKGNTRESDAEANKNSVLFDDPRGGRSGILNTKFIDNKTKKETTVTLKIKQNNIETVENH